MLNFDETQIEDTTLCNMLRNLATGKSLPLTYVENQRGNKIVDEELSLDDGQWVMEGIACRSSMDFGLGTCRCNSHSSTWSQEVDRATALNAIMKVIEKRQTDRTKRDKEIAWLNQAIQETGK